MLAIVTADMHTQSNMFFEWTNVSLVCISIAPGKVSTVNVEVDGNLAYVSKNKTEPIMVHSMIYVTFYVD